MTAVPRIARVRILWSENGEVPARSFHTLAGADAALAAAFEREPPPEGGAYNKTPHDVVLRWFRDCLDLLTAHGIGYALWSFRGSFGILDSGRADVPYENWYCHKLDRQFLDLLREF